MVHDCILLARRQPSIVLGEHTGEQAVAIRGQVDTHDFGALVGNNIKETRILVGEAIMVLSPDNSRQEDVERGDLGTPFHLETLLNPLAVLGDS